MQQSKTLSISYLMLLLQEKCCCGCGGVVILAHFSPGISPFPSIWASLSSLLWGKDAASQKVEIANGHFLSLCFKGGDLRVWGMMYRQNMWEK